MFLWFAALARMIHKDFYCNRRYAAGTSLMAGGPPGFPEHV
jgi:hypothetical protein